MYQTYEPIMGDSVEPLLMWSKIRVWSICHWPTIWKQYENKKSAKIKYRSSRLSLIYDGSVKEQKVIILVLDCENEGWGPNMRRLWHASIWVYQKTTHFAVVVHFIWVLESWNQPVAQQTSWPIQAQDDAIEELACILFLWFLICLNHNNINNNHLDFYKDPHSYHHHNNDN